MNIQEEFDKLSEEEKYDFLFKNLDKETIIEIVDDKVIPIDEVLDGAYSYADIQAYMIDYAGDFGLVVGSDGDNLTSRFLEENQVSIDEVMECYSEEEIDNWLKNRK